jgi:hypothetical protein
MGKKTVAEPVQKNVAGEKHPFLALRFHSWTTFAFFFERDKSVFSCLISFVTYNCSLLGPSLWLLGARRSCLASTDSCNITFAPFRGSTCWR